MGLVHLSEGNFEVEVKNFKGTVLVDFYADWCGPCKMMAPVMEELASELDGKCKVSKLDVDGAQNIAAEFGVMSIPTLIVFKDGKEAERITGAVPKEKLIDILNKHI